MKRKILLGLVIALFSLGLSAQEQKETKIVATERTFEAEFGAAVEIEDDFAFVGAPENYTDVSFQDSIKDAGAVFIYKKDTEGNWLSTQKIVAPDRESRGKFGLDVAVYDTTLLIGSDKDKVYVFDKNISDTWVYKQTITDADGQTFGASVSIHKGYAVIGDTWAWGTFAGGVNQPAGAAYIYERDASGTWAKVKKIMASDFASGDRFGESVDVFNDFIIVGNALHNDKRGAAYLYQRSTEGVWSELEKLEPPNARTYANFGKTVRIKDTVIVIGSIADNYDADDNNYVADAGAVYVFIISSADTCVFSEKIVAPVRNAKWDRFGSAIDFNSNFLIVGVDREDEDSNEENALSNAGAAYVYERNGAGQWNFGLKITPDDREANDLFGHDVALYNNSFIVGAPYNCFDANSQDSVSKAGSSYIFELSNLPSIAVQPVSINNLCSGSEAVFAVAGGKIQNYQWQFSTDEGGTWTNITNNEQYTGATSDSLVVKAGIELNNCKFFCAVSNSFGSLNSDTVSLSIINDTEDPVVTSTHTDLVIYADRDCEVALPDYTLEVDASDNCDTELEITQNPVAGTSIYGAENPVTLTITDNASNSTEISFNVTVGDEYSPVITSYHNDKYFDAGADCEVILEDYTADINATDNCDAELTVTQNPVAGTSITGLDNIITLTVTDDAGNTDEVTFSIDVEDKTDPTITCPADTTIYINPGDVSYTVQGTELDPVSFDDNCGVLGIANYLNEESTLDAYEFPLGYASVTWLVADNFEHRTTCSFSITVEAATSSTNIVNSQGFAIYPNPSSGILNIDFKGLTAKSLVLSDLSGRQVMKMIDIQANEMIDISELKNGVYTISVKTDNAVFTKQIIKK